RRSGLGSEGTNPIDLCVFNELMGSFGILCGWGGLVTFLGSLSSLGSNPNLRVARNGVLSLPGLLICEGDGEVVRYKLAAARVSRERGVMRRAGAPISTLARRGLGTGRPQALSGSGIMG